MHRFIEILTFALWAKHYYYPHFTYEEAEAQKSNINCEL